MERTLSRPPRTMMEVYKMLPEGTLAELIEGSIYMSPAPQISHQEILAKLFVGMYEVVTKRDLGKIYFSPLDVYFDEERNTVQPDIVFISKGNLSALKEDGVHGVPDLIVEILSSGNKSHDLKVKKNLYEKFGVREFWIINPQTKESCGYQLQNGSYSEFHKSVGEIQSPLLDAKFNF